MKKVNFNHAELYFFEAIALDGLTVSTYAHHKPLPGYDSTRMTRPIHVLHYVVSGKGFFCGEPFEGPCGFLMVPDQEHYYTVDPSPEAPPFEQYWVEFSGEKAQQLLTDAGFSQHSYIFFERNFSRIFDAFAKIASSETLSQRRSNFLAISVFFELLSLHSTEQGDSSIQKQEYVYASQIRKYILDHYQQPITATDIASSVHLSIKYVSKLFKKVYGQTPIHYLNYHRIRCAQALLLQNNIAINELASLVGIPDASHFCKLFKAYSNGISPTKFAKRK